MAARLGLRRAVALAACSLAIVSCDSETIDLLPPELSQNDGAGGSSTQGGGNGAGASGAPTAGDASTGAHGGTSAGTAGAGGNASCAGLGCAGFNFGGFGGSVWVGDCNPEVEQCTFCESDQHCPNDWHCITSLGLCVECRSSDDCRWPYLACDPGIGRCSPACEDTIDCDEGYLCNLEHGTCVQCLDHNDCDSDGDEDTHYCARTQHRCVECLDHADCGRDHYCDIARGRCEQ